jgi:hypothetical protein
MVLKGFDISVLASTFAAMRNVTTAKVGAAVAKKPEGNLKLRPAATSVNRIAITAGYHSNGNAR